MLRLASTDELASDALWSLGAIAVTERDGGFDAGFESDAAEREAVRQLSGRWPVDVTTVDEASWGDEWRRWAHPITEGPIAVRPAWIDGDGVAIEPRRSFGIGSHPTTRLALRAMLAAAEVPPFDSALDVGTGSGVLAIAATVLGATRVLAIDIDDAAVDVARANVDANGVADRVTVSSTPIAEIAGPFDVVVANLGGLLLPVELAPDLARCTGHRLIVSGLLDPDAGGPRLSPLDIALQEHGLAREATQSFDGWCAATWRRT